MAAGGVGASSGGRLGADGADEASWTFFNVFCRFLCIVLGLSSFSQLSLPRPSWFLASRSSLTSRKSRSLVTTSAKKGRLSSYTVSQHMRIIHKSTGNWTKLDQVFPPGTQCTSTRDVQSLLRLLEEIQPNIGTFGTSMHNVRFSSTHLRKKQSDDFFQ